MRVGHRHRRLIALALGITLISTLAVADPALIDGLATDDPKTLAAAVTAIEQAPITPELADALFGAARACEDRLLDPARALVLYERLLRELPEARVAAAAERRAEQLRAVVGPHHEHAREAAAFAQLVAAADTLSTDELVGRADALAAEPWPGAPDVALWVADVLRRQRHFELAQARYAEVVRRWPGRAVAARRGGAGNAIEAGAWSLAERLVAELPATDPADILIRDDLLDGIASGRGAQLRYRGAWALLGLAVLALLGSLAEAILRGGRRRPSLRPPTEVLFLAPIAVVLTGIAFATRAVVAPAVAQITLGGVAFAWISGATLDLLRARAREVRLRAVLHAIACVAGAVALGYIAIVAGGLVDLLAETVQAGPGV